MALIMSMLLEKDKKRKIRSAHDVKRMMNMVTGCTDMSGFKSLDLVIEAVFEDLDLKQNLLRGRGSNQHGHDIRVEYILIADLDIAEARPIWKPLSACIISLPVEKMPLLEIITTPDTADWVTATCGVWKAAR